MQYQIDRPLYLPADASAVPVRIIMNDYGDHCDLVLRTTEQQPHHETAQKLLMMIQEMLQPLNVLKRRDDLFDGGIALTIDPDPIPLRMRLSGSQIVFSELMPGGRSEKGRVGIALIHSVLDKFGITHIAKSSDSTTLNEIFIQYTPVIEEVKRD